jgi:hypothetical protein
MLAMTSLILYGILIESLPMAAVFSENVHGLGENGSTDALILTHLFLWKSRIWCRLCHACQSSGWFDCFPFDSKANR